MRFQSGEDSKLSPRKARKDGLALCFCEPWLILWSGTQFLTSFRCFFHVFPVGWKEERRFADCSMSQTLFLEQFCLSPLQDRQVAGRVLLQPAPTVESRQNVTS